MYTKIVKQKSTEQKGFPIKDGARQVQKSSDIGKFGGTLEL